MVFKSLERIKSALPEVIHVVMFYNNGIIYQTTFEQSFNIPKIGENLAKLVIRVQKIYDLCNFKVGDYKKLIFETDDISMILLKLGEDSNIALFFKKEIDINQHLKSIRRYLKKIEVLIDMDKIGIKFQDLEIKEKDLKESQGELSLKYEKLEDLKKKQVDAEEKKDQERLLQFNKEITDLKEISSKIEREIEEKRKEIEKTKEEIEKEKNRI